MWRHADTVDECGVFSENVHVMWSACVYEYGLQGDSAWCSLFPENVTRIMEYYEDLQSYWLDGYGHDINYQQACVLLNDVLTLFTLVLAVDL